MPKHKSANFNPISKWFIQKQSFFSVQIAILITGGLLIIIVLISLKLVRDTKFISIARGHASSIVQMSSAIKGGLHQIKGYSNLVGFAVVTIYV